MCTIGQVLLATPKEEEKNSLLDVFMPKYRRSQGGGKEIKNIRALRKLVDGPDIRICKKGVGNSTAYFRGQQVDVVRND